MATTRPIAMPAEWTGKVPTRIFIDEAMGILRAAAEAKVALKMLGGLAIIDSQSQRGRIRKSAGQVC